jgi:YidC/Oxa1 family membrane protein insertase
MNNTRILLWFLFLGMIWLAFNQWLEDYRPERAPTATPAADEAEAPAPGAPDELPSVFEPPLTAAEPGADESPATPEPADLIHVRTDVLDLWLDPHGGDIVRADLPEYPVDKERPDRVVRLLDYDPAMLWEFQTGVRHSQEAAGPTHLADYTSAQSSYELAAGDDDLVVTLEWVGSAGIRARKIYTFHRGRYDIDLSIAVDNGGTTPWPAVAYAQMTRLHIPIPRKYMAVETYSFTGPVLYDGDSYEKLDVEDLATNPVSETLMGGWFASIQHHFLAAAIPPADEDFRYQAVTRGADYLLTAVGGVHEIPPQSSESFPFQLFVGPKLQAQLEATREGLELTVDYGKLTVLAQPLFWLLEKVHGVLGNWGWSIMAVTFLIKLAFYKLTATSGRSMARMRRIAPRMKALQERFKDDRQALSQAMMDLYKKEKVNPAAGCLPILIQMPFFFAFYWVLIESVEMRQAPFVLWINDLSVRDPYFVLPLLMGAAMFFQTRLNPTPPDPTQARIMQIMPLIFTGFFAFFPAGLVIYWLTNTVLSILQQWRINKLVAAEA